MAMEQIPQSGPQYGRRLMPHVLDAEAHTNPHRTFAAILKSSEISDGFVDITYGQMAHAVNFMAYRLQEFFGASLKYDFETLTYFGLPDLRYNIVFYAAIKCGYKVRRDQGSMSSK